MADLHLNLATKTQDDADIESAKVYPWLTAEIGNQGLPSKIFDSIAFIGHEIANNRLLRNDFTRQVRLRILKNQTQITLAIRYDGQPFNDVNGEGSKPEGVRGVIAHINAQYGDGSAAEGETTAIAGETLYTTNRIIFPLNGNS